MPDTEGGGEGGAAASSEAAAAEAVEGSHGGEGQGAVEETAPAQEAAGVMQAIACVRVVTKGGAATDLLWRYGRAWRGGSDVFCLCIVPTLPRSALVLVVLLCLSPRVPPTLQALALGPVYTRT